VVKSEIKIQIQIQTCSLCPNEEKEQTSQNIPMVNQRLSFSQNFESMFLSEVPTKQGGCLKCCNGDRLVSTYTPSTEETWKCTIDMETMPHYAEECFKVPKTMKFGKTEFSVAEYVISKPGTDNT
jgi:hypothetical protein